MSRQFNKMSYELPENIIDDVKSYINNKYKCDKQYNLKSKEPHRGEKKTDDELYYVNIPDSEYNTDSLEARIGNIDNSFADVLFRLIVEKKMSDVECYKRAHISRKTFSKIRCDKKYRPSKETVISLAISLRLTINEANNFLSAAGYALSYCYKFDIIIEYFISNGIYDITVINETLYRFDQPCIG